MIITKKTLARRTMLRGVGAALALPMLDAMVPALSGISGRAAEPVRRLGWVYSPNGMAMDAWTPAATESLELSTVLSPLASYREQTVVVSGLAQGQAEALGDGNGEHTRATATWLNGVHPRETEGADVRAGKTVDQIAADQLGRTTPLSSLELAIDQDFLVGSCDNGYSCIYMNTISWRDETTPLPMQNNPRVVFERLFGEAGSTANRQSEFRKDRSILDAITSDLARLQREVGLSDRARVTQYLDAVRAIERRIQLSEQNDTELPELERPVGIPESYREHVELMFDLMALAYQVDMTRVFTFMLGRELNGRAYPEIGIPESHHGLSHHRDDPTKLAQLAKINAYHVSLFRHFLDQLENTPDGDGSLLDHSLLLYGAALSDSNKHLHFDLPLLLVGGGAGQLQGGRHLQYPRDTPMTNLLVSQLDKAGVRLDDGLGDSTGRLVELAPLASV
ncbi:MAG: hypothetical protein CL484_01290 [Acidobacteria bacterium]|nr:hypothetical protein [Acidobacteriota bacterium]|tara:strand:- start:2250 stop:3602 length:1353 start_codon:yes stop_codon:yes gene_type:complete